MDTTKKSIPINDFMKEKKAHGNLEYPIAIYHVDLRNLYMGFVRWHWHEELEFDVVTEGRMECLVGDESFIMEKGDCIFINQNVMHSIHPIGDEPGHFDAIVFHPTFLFNYSMTYMNTKYLIPIVGNLNLKSFLMNSSYQHFDKVTEYITELSDANMQKELGYEVVTKICLARLWLLLLKEFNSSDISKNPQESLSLGESRAKDAVIYIQEHYNEPISLDEIATAIHVSKSECCRCFKRSLHCTPFEYLMKYRIFMASIKISQDTGNVLSFSDIASSVGFNNVSYFNKLFKLFLKCTPSQYRKNIKNGKLKNENGFSSTSFEEFEKHAAHKN